MMAGAFSQVQGRCDGSSTTFRGSPTGVQRSIGSRASAKRSRFCAGDHYPAALDGALPGTAAASASLTTCIVRRMLEGLTLIESRPSWVR